MKIRWRAGVAAFFSLLLVAQGAPAACDNPPRLRFSLIPQSDAKDNLASFKGLLSALESELGRPVDAVAPSSYSSVVEGLLAGSVDIAMLGPASYATAKNGDPDIHAFATYASKAGAFQEEGPYYRSLLIVRSDSRFHSRESLRGAKVALVDPISTSGAVLPRHFFKALVNEPLERFFGSLVYTGGHDKSASAVASGKVDAAFVASVILSDFVGNGKAAARDYTVLWKSEPIPLDPFVYRGSLCPPLKEKIRKVFLRNNGEEFRDALGGLNSTRFSPISDEKYKVIRDVLRATP